MNSEGKKPVDFNDLKTDEVKETAGVWHSLSATTRVKLARIDNKNYSAFLKERLQPYRHLMRAGTLPADVLEAVTLEALARHTVVDWDGFTEGGLPCPYSLETAKRLLREARQFRELVVQLASTDDYYRFGEREEDAKNS